MKIFDCFMYFDEEMILDLRLNILNKYVDYFVIVESTFTHRGEKRELKFNQNKFEQFKDKIIYLIYDQVPENIENINANDTEKEKSRKLIMNAIFRENGQRNFIEKGLKSAESEDIILISDVDEIPNLNDLDFNQAILDLGITSVERAFPSARKASLMNVINFLKNLNLEI